MSAFTVIAERSGAIGKCLRKRSAAALIAGLLACSLASASGPAATPADPPNSTLADPSPEQARELLQSDRYRRLAAELRCLVCQNQTLADSNADLATDLRNEVLRQMSAGRDDTQIKDNLVARYGEFVLYRPTYSGRNLALWAGPAVLLALGAFLMWRISRARRTSAASVVDESQLKRVDARLKDL
jgi:cytochrome c-type biogenesis protein CcmH